MDTTLRLHVWPSQWDIPSIHPQCLATILYAQLAIPGKFEVHECTDPDSSPNGLLPYLTHGLTTLATFPSIIKYISGLRGAYLDAPLSATEKAQTTAWTAFVEAHLGDLVACAFYAINDNFHQCTRPALASLLSLPQRYYLPDRIRESYQPRLDAAGLWDVNVEKKRDREQHSRVGALQLHQRVQQTFAKEKVITKARTHLEILVNLLGNRSYVFRDHPTSLDTILAAHVLLLTETPFPNDTLHTLIEQSYPSLHAHAKRVYVAAFGGPERPPSPLSTSVSFLGPIPEPAAAPRPPPLKVIRAEQQSFISLIPHLLPIQRPVSRGQAHATTSDTTPKPDEAELDKEEKEALEKEAAEEREFARMRWAWTGLALAAVVGWGMSGLRIQFLRVGEVEENADVDEEEVDEDTEIDDEEDGGDEEDEDE